MSLSRKPGGAACVSSTIGATPCPGDPRSPVRHPRAQSVISVHHISCRSTTALVLICLPAPIDLEPGSKLAVVVHRKGVAVRVPPVTPPQIDRPAAERSRVHISASPPHEEARNTGV